MQSSARGRVCAVTGIGICLAMAKDGASGIAAGFSAEELPTAVAAIPWLSQKGGLFIRRRYPRAVKEEGNPTAMALVRECMEPCPSEWRGLGVIPGSGLRLLRRTAALRHQALRRQPGHGLPMRRRAARAHPAPRMPPLRQGLHAGAPRRRLHGVARGRLPGLASLRHAAARSSGSISKRACSVRPSASPDRRRRVPVLPRWDMQTAATGARGSRRRRGADPFRCSRRTARRCSQSARRAQAPRGTPRCLRRSRRAAPPPVPCGPAA